MNPSNKWLGNVPLSAISRLRAEGENEEFRRELNERVAAIVNDSKGTSHDSAAVERALSQLLATHDKQVSNLLNKYDRIFAPQAVSGWVTMGASWLQLFPEATLAAQAALVAGYLGTKAAQTLEKRSINSTLMGVLAASNSKSG